MALGDPYADLADLKDRIQGLEDTEDDIGLTSALVAASEEVEAYCGRQFNQATVATARIYRPESSTLVIPDDIATSAGLILQTDQSDSGTFDSTWSSSDYELEPLNGVMNGVPGWPYTRIRAVGTRWFLDYRYFEYYYRRRAPVQITAVWGWPAVPERVKQATLILAQEMHKLKDAPFGVAGFDQYGPVRVRQNPKVATLLSAFRRSPVLVG